MKYEKIKKQNKNIFFKTEQNIKKWRNKHMKNPKHMKNKRKIQNPKPWRSRSQKEELESVGELSRVCSQIVLKCLYLARIADQTFDGLQTNLREQS